MRMIRFLVCFCVVVLVPSCQKRGEKSIVNRKVHYTIHFGNKNQTMEGFGVNISPAQWRNGHLKPVLDKICTDLGSTIVRLDCYGSANWLSPDKYDSINQVFDLNHLKEIYTGKVFTDAWETARYLKNKGVNVVFNVSGKTPLKWNTFYEGKKSRLRNFDAYAEMVVSMLVWARDKEKLSFTYLMPFNETDIGSFVEGPTILNEDIAPAIKAIIKKLDKHGFKEVKLIVMDDSKVHLDRANTMLSDTNNKDRIHAFGFHTYGDFFEGDVYHPFGGKSLFKLIAQKTDSSGFRNKNLWMTEYGDLDQTGLVEYAVAMRSTRRLSRFINDGFGVALAWDAFDNFHVHDSAWAQYGLFSTDTSNWTYMPKKRYFAAKQVYRFIPNGFRNVKVTKELNWKDPYVIWKNEGKHLTISAFISPDGKDYTIFGVSFLEKTIDLELDIKGLWLSSNTITFLETNATDHLTSKRILPVSKDKLVITLAPMSIFTLTTL